MANTLKVEFLTLTTRNQAGLVISQVYAEATQATTVATLGAGRIPVPVYGGSDQNQWARLTAITGAVKVCWGGTGLADGPNATVNAGLRCVPGVPEVVWMRAGMVIDAIDVT